MPIVPSDPLIACKGLNVTFGSNVILDNVSLSLRPQEIVTLVGPNGSGKTTLSRALVGTLPLTKGSVKRHPQLTVGYVPQRLEIDASLPITVARFLDLPVRHDPKQREKTISQTGIGTILNTALADLSGGQMQRVLLAHALMKTPNLLILDEPTQGMDQPGAAGFYSLIDDIRREQGCGVFMVSHDLHVVMAASDRVICLNGHICCEGAPDLVASTPAYRALFGRGTKGTMALYRHEHDHNHDHSH